MSKAYEEIIEYFDGVSNVVEQISKTPWPITRAAVYAWKDNDVPEGRAYQFEVITEGDLMASRIIELQEQAA